MRVASCGNFRSEGLIAEENVAFPPFDQGWHPETTKSDLIYLNFVLLISTHLVTTKPEPICRSNSRFFGKGVMTHKGYMDVITHSDWQAARALGAFSILRGLCWKNATVN